MSKEHISLPEIEFRHRQEVQLRFNDVDRFGHVNNSVYIQFLDLAKLEYFKLLSGGKIDWKSFGLVVANINCNFLAPSYLEEKLEVVSAVTHLGNKSLVLEQRILNSAGEVKVSAGTTMVNLDLSSGSTAPISDEWRKRISDFEKL